MLELARPARAQHGTAQAIVSVGRLHFTARAQQQETS